MSPIDQIISARPMGGYRVIYADPAWSFDNWSHKGAARAAARHYDTMGTDNICAMPVEACAAVDAVLFMWMSAPKMEDGFRVMRAWGFTPKAKGFCWVKSKPSGAEHLGMGYYTRSNTEDCWIATRGRPKRPLSGGVRELLEAPVREHSRKPDEAYDRIEAMYPGPYLELFARNAHPHWTAWGNETEKFGEVA